MSVSITENCSLTCVHGWPKSVKQKKKDNERYATSIKNTKVASTKASYRKMKINRAASYDRQIESIKKQIENAKAGLARERKNKK